MTELTTNQKKRIDAALFVARNIIAIDKAFPEATLTPENAAAIHKAHAVLASQLARIEANSAKYVVVGLEKSGKSTFLNALIGLDVLPARGERCTYAITSLRVSKGPFQLTIRPKFCSLDEFRSREAELERAAKVPGPAAVAAAADLSKLRIQRGQLEALITGEQKLTLGITEKLILSGINDRREADRDFAFTDRKITDIGLARACLKVVVTTEAAFVVQEVEIDISSPDPLFTTDGKVELVDLPGLDSGLTIHRELAKATMKHADAIIFVQNILNPTHQEHVAALLGYADEGDIINFREKIFVFLNRADEKTDAVVNDNYNAALKEWAKHQVDSSHVFVGSAAGQLLQKPNDLSRETLAAFVNTDALRSDQDIPIAAGLFLQSLKESMAIYNRQIQSGNAQPGNVQSDDTGFRRLVVRLDEFKSRQQAANVSSRIDESLREIKNNSRDFVQTLNSKLKNQPHIFDNTGLDEEIVFQSFLESYVDSAKSSVLSAIRRITGRDPEQNASEYDVKVKERIDAIFDRLYYMKEENIEEIARPHKGGQRDVIKFQMAWRELLFQEIENSLRGMGDEIGSAIYGEITEVLDQASDLIFRNDIVEKTLIGARETYDAEIRASVNALLMQFAKPLIISAIRPLPLKTTDTARSDSLAQYRRELKAFSQFYTGERTEFSDAHSYIAGDVHVAAPARAKNGANAGAEKPAPASNGLFRFRANGNGVDSAAGNGEEPNPVKDHKYDAPFEQAKNAVRKDLDLCRELLSNALARAAGLSAFRLSQFETLEKRFGLPDSENRWKGAIQRASKTPGTKTDVEKVFLAWQKERTQYDENLATIAKVLKRHNEL
jgi:hypothetical protein